MIKKNIDWKKDFDEFVEAEANTSFSWGKWDCILFTNAMIKKLSNENLLPKEWKWKDKKEAMQCIDKYGKGKGLAAAIDNAVKKVEGIKKIDQMFMSKGDFLVYKEETELSGVFDGAKILGPSDEGLITKCPLTVDIKSVWSINV